MSREPPVTRPDPRPRHVVEGRSRWSKSRRGDYHAWLLTRDALDAGWARVRHNKGSHGWDRVTVEAFAKDSDAEIENLLTDLSRDAYRPGPLRPVPITKKIDGRVL